MSWRTCVGESGGTGADGVEVAQGGTGVQQRVVTAAGMSQGDGGVVAGPAGAVAVVLALAILDGLLEMPERTARVTGITVDDAEGMVGHGEFVDCVVGEQVERLVIGVGCVVEVPEQLFAWVLRRSGRRGTARRRCCRAARCLRAAEGVVLVEQLKAVLVPVLGLAEVAQGGDVFVGVAEVATRRWLRRAGRRSAGKVPWLPGRAARSRGRLVPAGSRRVRAGPPRGCGSGCAAGRRVAGGVVRAAAACSRSQAMRAFWSCSAAGQSRASRAMRTR